MESKLCCAFCIQVINFVVIRDCAWFLFLARRDQNLWTIP